ncbi:MAG: zinc-ribbon domain-containing protein [Filifactoraceae bacterium]
MYRYIGNYKIHQRKKRRFMYCKNCGTKMDDGQNTCQACNTIN